MLSSPQELVNRYYRAINEEDWGVYDQLFTPDAALEAPGDVTGRGPAAMRAFDQVWKTAAPDFTITPLRQVVTGDAVMSENAAAGTHTAVLVTPGGDLPATGRRFGGKYVGVFEIREGRISAQHIYFDRLIVVEQLGTPAATAPVG